MPLHLASAPAVFLLYINEDLHSMLHRYVVVYTEDLLMYSCKLKEPWWHDFWSPDCTSNQGTVNFAIHDYLRTTVVLWFHELPPVFHLQPQCCHTFHFSNQGCFTPPPTAEEIFNSLKQWFTTVAVLYQPDPSIFCVSQVLLQLCIEYSTSA